jgi:hypothetical protein
MTDLAWWKLGGYVLLSLWLMRMAWLILTIEDYDND